MVWGKTKSTGVLWLLTMLTFPNPITVPVISLVLQYDKATWNNTWVELALSRQSRSIVRSSLDLFPNFLINSASKAATTRAPNHLSTKLQYAKSKVQIAIIQNANQITIVHPILSIFCYEDFKNFRHDHTKRNSILKSNVWCDGSGILQLAP